MGAIYRGSASRTQRQQNDFGGGTNTGFSSFDIQENESTEEYGWDTDKHPARVTGKGRTTYGASGSAVTRLLTNFGTTHLVRAVGAQLQYYNGTAWTNITGTVANADWSATNFNDLLLLVNGTDRKKWNGTTLADITGSPPAGAKYITNDNVRAWMALGDEIHFSAFQDSDDWTSAEDSGSVQYYTPNGGDITALTEFYGDKWVFKKDSMAVIKGTNYFNFALVSVSNDIGCVSFKTIKEVGDTMFWLGENDVYGHQGGKPFPIGQKIRSYLDAINWTHIDKCCAITDGLRYYLCLVTGAETEPNVRLVFDPRYNVWEVCHIAGTEDYRYSAELNNVTYVGDASGQTWKFNDGITDNGAAIPWGITTRPFDEGFPEAEKQYKEMHLQGYFPIGSTLQLSVSTTDRGDDWTVINFDPIATGAVTQNKNCIIPLDMVPLTNWARFRLSGTGPVEIQQMQRYFKVCRVQR
jgi:hypothetical protein